MVEGGRRVYFYPAHRSMDVKRIVNCEFHRGWKKSDAALWPFRRKLPHTHTHTCIHACMHAHRGAVMTSEVLFLCESNFYYDPVRLHTQLKSWLIQELQNMPSSPPVPLSPCLPPSSPSCKICCFDARWPDRRFQNCHKPHWTEWSRKRGAVGALCKRDRTKKARANSCGRNFEVGNYLYCATWKKKESPWVYSVDVGRISCHSHCKVLAFCKGLKILCFSVRASSNGNNPTDVNSEWLQLFNPLGV